MSGPDDARTRTAVQEGWPVAPDQRTWGSLALFGVAVSAAVATWVFIIGGYVSFYLPAGSGTIVMFAGGLVGILLVVLALLPVTSRYGIDSVAASVPQLGRRGSLVALALTYASVIGWNCLLLVFLGRAAAEILISTGAFDESARDALVVVFALVGASTVVAILRGGPSAVKDVAPYIAGGVGVLAVVILVVLIAQAGWSSISDAEPSAPAASKAYNYTTGFEIMVVSMLSWWPYLGGIIRLAPGAKTSVWPSVWGLALPVALLSLIGLFAGLAVPDSGGDPTTFLVDEGGLAIGVPALLFIMLANIGTTMVGVYVSTIALKQMPVVQRRLSWNTTVLVAILPVLVVVALFPGWVFDEFGTFLAFIGVAFAPLCGMQMVDYLLLRRNRVDLRAMFLGRRGSAYDFWGGFNPAGFSALIVGAATYVWLLDPVKYTYHSPYEYVSATLPSAAVSALVYYLVTRLVVIPAGRGGYTAGTAPLQETRAAPAAEPLVGAGSQTER